jgi:hypothetical protein
MPIGGAAARQLLEASENDLGLAVMKYIMDRDRTWVPEIKRLGQRATSAAVAARDLAFELRAHMPGIPWPNEGAFEAVRLAAHSIVSAEHFASLWSLLRANRTVQRDVPDSVEALVALSSSRKADEFDTFAILCRRLAAQAERFLAAEPERRERARALRRGQVRGALPDLALAEFVMWLREHNVGARRAAKVLAEREHRNAPGGIVLSEDQWWERLHKALSPKRGRPGDG